MPNPGSIMQVEGTPGATAVPLSGGNPTPRRESRISTSRGRIDSLPESSIANLWKQAKTTLFNGSEAPLNVDDIQKVMHHGERSILRVTSFSCSLETEEEFRMIEQPFEKMKESYIVLLGVLTCLGKGKLAGVSLQKEVLAYGDQISAAYADVERILASKDVEILKSSLSVKTGLLLEVLKKFEKVPRENHVAVKKRMVGQIQQLRDVSRELISADEESMSYQLGKVIEAYEKILKKLIVSIRSDQCLPIDVLEAALNNVIQICGSIDEVALSLEADDDIDLEDFDHLDSLNDIQEENEDEDGQEKTKGDIDMNKTDSNNTDSSNVSLFKKDKLQGTELDDVEVGEARMMVEQLERETLDGKFYDACKSSAGLEVTTDELFSEIKQEFQKLKGML